MQTKKKQAFCKVLVTSPSSLTVSISLAAQLRIRILWAGFAPSRNLQGAQLLAIAFLILSMASRRMVYDSGPNSIQLFDLQTGQRSFTSHIPLYLRRILPCTHLRIRPKNPTLLSSYTTKESLNRGWNR